MSASTSQKAREPAGLLSHLPEQVTVYEVGPRDGLQNESRMIPTADKIAMINALSNTGLRHIEITSFVNPKWIPQLADASDVARGIQRLPEVSYSCLVPNRRGLESALQGGMREVAIFLSASETHNKKNVNKTIADTLAAFDEVMGPARAAGVAVRAYVSTVYGCPYEGPVDPERVVALVQRLLALGVYQISLGDTIGVATPRQVQSVLLQLLAFCPQEKLALHFHDTRGTALANILAGVALGITTVDSALGGLGGCPYAPGASGNVATEDVVYMLEGMGIQTGVNLEKLVDTSRLVASWIGHEMPSKYLKASLGERVRNAKGVSGFVGAQVGERKSLAAEAASISRLTQVTAAPSCEFRFDLAATLSYSSLQPAPPRSPTLASGRVVDAARKEML